MTTITNFLFWMKVTYYNEMATNCLKKAMEAESRNDYEYWISLFKRYWNKYFALIAEDFY